MLARTSARPRGFQSAPRTEARGDLSWECCSSWPCCFNPLPVPKQGETRDGVPVLQNTRRFNPLPVPKQGETERNGLRGLVKDRFQSAPRTEARGDFFQADRQHHVRCFNPLPVPKQGETHFRQFFRHSLYVSIRSPYRSKGRRRSK